MHYKTLFVSDIHLGTKQCQVQYLLKFLHNNTFDNVYLIDHNTFIQKVLRLSRKGTNVVMIPGNHDAILREWIAELSPFFFGDIVIVNQYEYTSVNGQRFLLIHGDEFDGAIRSIGWL
jgi:UDP-2,3-diacylglucosamine pyrophosphatase LpxH